MRCEEAKERVLWCCRCGANCAAIGLGRRLKPTLLKVKGAGPAKFERDADCAQEASGTKDWRAD